MSWNDKRPMSPHLQVYDLPLTAKLSILHRGTGAVLFMGVVLWVLLLATAASGPQTWASMHSFLASWFGKLILFGFTFSLYYHLCNGIRHLFWDMGKGFELRDAQKAGIVVIVASLLLTILTWLVAL